MTTARPHPAISQYTPTDTAPELGGLDVHPEFDTRLMRDLLRPELPLWSPGELRDLTGLLVSEFTSSLLPVAHVDAEERWWARLGLTAGVEVWLLTWAPGQGTRPHGHGGASGSFAVLFGELDEQYRYPGGPVREQQHSPGAAIGFGSARAHQVTNSGVRDAASVHAYSPPLLPVNHYSSLAAIPSTVADF